MPKKSRKKRPIRTGRQAGKANAIVPGPHVESRILLIRGQRALLDLDLAALYDVSTGVLNQAVRRNRARFPEDFMFQLTWEEVDSLRSQIVILNKGLDSKGIPASSGRRRRSGRGTHLKFRPYAFTEQGVAMLSSVLRSPRAVKVNIEIMRAFVRLRQWMASHADLAHRLDELEAKYDGQFRVVFDAIRALMEEPEDEEATRPRIGFRTPAHDGGRARRRDGRGRRKQLVGTL